LKLFRNWIVVMFCI